MSPATKSSKPTISALILARNEQQMLANCLDTLQWCDEILVLDNGSTDATVGIAEQAGCRIISFQSDDFARLRNELLKRAKTDWIFYVDADERVTPKLAREILVHTETSTAAAMTMHRQNVLYGKPFHHGGWEKDRVTRVFKRSQLQEWTGQVHESPVYEGPTIELFTSLLHFTHRSTSENLVKSIAWTKIEAELLVAGSTPPVTLKTLFRKSIMEVFRRAILWRGHKDGLEGWIEALVQGLNKLLVYIQVWELQRKPSLEKSYQQYEDDVAETWKNDPLLKVEKE